MSNGTARPQMSQTDSCRSTKWGSPRPTNQCSTASIAPEAGDSGARSVAGVTARDGSWAHPAYFESNPL